MTITVTNQRPAVLDPMHTISCTGDYDPIPVLQKTVIDPLLEPLNPHAPAIIADDKGTDITGQVPDMLIDAFSADKVSPASQTTAREILGQTMVHFDQSTLLPASELFAVQAGQRNKLPTPSPRVIYTAQDDVIPAAKGLLAGSSDEGILFASLAYAYHPNTLGFWFQSQTEFQAFTSWLAQQIQTLPAGIPGDTRKLMLDTTQLDLKGLTESVIIRKDDTDGNDEFSYARLMVNLLMGYVEQQRTQAATNGTDPTLGALPFTVGELFCPRSLVFVNVEAHARATAKKVTKEWNLINRSLASPIKVVSNKQLSKLTSLPRAVARAKSLGGQQRPGQPGNRSARITFRKAPPSKIDLYKDLTRVLKRMGKVNKSQNVFRSTRTSFLRANRRDPDDVNKPGRITSVQYMPDIHVYVDTSGSISEENYQEAMLMLIRIAKKLNVNLYFNSFSHILSQEVMLHVENKSVGQIWKEFRRVPKVTGGTEFKQVWDYVNASPRRRRRLNLMITDFEWDPPSTREDHPKNLYYAPCSAMDWSDMVDNAKDYADAMAHIDPTLRQKMLGMNQ